MGALCECNEPYAETMQYWGLTIEALAGMSERPATWTTASYMGKHTPCQHAPMCTHNGNKSQDVGE